MSTPPVLPLMADGTLPPVPFLLRWLARTAQQGVHRVRLEHLPPGNGSLPDLLASAGIGTLMLMHPPLPLSFRWEGCSGGRVVVGDGDPGTALHHGELPWSASAGGIDQTSTDVLAHARVQDARAVCAMCDGGTTAGASWSRLLDVPDTPFTTGTETTVPASGAALGAWNPLALGRRVVLALPAMAGTPPRGLRDHRGVRHPVQTVDDADGRRLLVSVQLGALEAVVFEASPEAVPGSHWEVTSSVIDNGRVRAELDGSGQVVRLCCDGRFVDWAGPALQPLIGEQPLGGTCAITVLEAGPVRGRIALTRSTPQGTLRLEYCLHAHEAVLRVAATWDGAGDMRLACPTLVRTSPLEVGGELAGWTVPQNYVAQMATAPIAGLRWARLAEADRHGVALFGLRPMRVSAAAGTLSVHVTRSTDIALCENAWPMNAPGIAAMALALGTPAHPADGPAAPLLRVVGDEVVPWWIGRPDGWRGELLLGQPHARRGRCTVYVAATEAVRHDLRGGSTALRRTTDGDGFEIDLAGGDLATVRWR